MDKVDCIIIGAGAVGLAVAHRLAARYKKTVVLERHPGFGRETSSRNSEVIHAGIYYPPASLKAALCVKGNRMLYEFCGQYGILYKKTAKLIVAVEDGEETAIGDLYANGLANGVPALSLLTKKEIRQLESAVRAQQALLSGTTGIFDSHIYMQTLEGLAERAGALFAYGCTVTRIEYINHEYRITLTDSDGQEERIHSQILINSCGLHSDKIAAAAGINVEAAGYKLFFSKGEYFSLRGIRRGLTSRLIYPAPCPDYLGIHTVLDLQGQLKLGPNAYYVNQIDYSIDETHRDEFYLSARKFLPFLKVENLIPDMAGIRPKLQGPGADFADFIICHETGRGYPGLVNLIGIESPGLTSSLAIAEYVSELL